MANGDAGDVGAYSPMQQKVRNMLIEIRMNGFARGKDFAVGRVEPRMAEFADNNGITLASKSIYMGPKSLFHSKRPSKEAVGKAVRSDKIIDFIRDRRKMDLYWDGECFIYTDYDNKFIINPNYKLKINRRRVRKVSYITAGKVDVEEKFDVGKYTKI